MKRQRQRHQGAAIGLFTCAITLVTLPSPATAAAPAAGTCYPDTKEYRRDATTGWIWATLWYCRTNIGAAVYEDANYQTKMATMQTSPSWFACYRRGAMHRGGNDVWYYTLADLSEPAFKRRQPWGYMPAIDVAVKVHPWPGVPACPTSAFPVTVRRAPR